MNNDATLNITAQNLFGVTQKCLNNNFNRYVCIGQISVARGVKTTRVLMRLFPYICHRHSFNI
jgi:hypothetical protein